MAVVSNSQGYGKIAQGSSIECLSQAGNKKAQLHQKHASMNMRSSNGAANSSAILNSSASGLAHSPSTMQRNKKALYRMLKK